MALPVALSADVAVNLVGNTADQSPLAATRSFPGDGSVPSDLGATGATPHDTSLSPQILHDAGNQQALATGAGPRANLPSGPLGIPGVVLDAYLHAQQVMGAEDPGCHLPWWLLAGIGKIESNQAENGEVDANGTTLRPILGPELNGQSGFAAIPAILGGRWTGDPVWQRAVGPMQFLPGTWLTWGRGGNPNNVYDSALAAGRYLCAGGGNLSQPGDEAAAVFSYNHSDSYVRIVLIWANAYRQGVTPLPEVVAAPQGPAPSNHPLPSRTPGAPGTVPAAPGSSAPAGPAPAGSPAGSRPGTPSKVPGGSTIPSRSTGGLTPTDGGTTPPPSTTSPPPPPPPPTTTTTPPCPTPDPSATSTPPPTSTTPPPPGCPTPTTTAPPAADPAATGTDTPPAT